MRGVLVGLIGSNIQKSLSPVLYEDACAQAGLRGPYHLMDLDLLPGRTLEGLIHAVCTAGFAGTNVTYPCKEAVLPLLDEVSPEARQIGAVNTVTVDGAGRACGHNTDRVGFRRVFEETFGGDAARGRTVLLVGAGGAGRGCLRSARPGGRSPARLRHRHGATRRALRSSTACSRVWASAALAATSPKR